MFVKKFPIFLNNYWTNYHCFDFLTPAFFTRGFCLNMMRIYKLCKFYKLANATNLIRKFVEFALKFAGSHHTINKFT